MVLLNTLPEYMVRRHVDDEETYLLPTVKVLVHAGRHSDYIRGLVAWTSQYSMITEKCRRQCHLPFVRLPVPATQTVAGNIIEVVGQSRIKISPHFNEERTDILDVLVVRQIHTKVTLARVHPIAKAILDDLQLADPTFEEPGDIDLVLGGPVLPSMMRPGSRSVYGRVCNAKETIFGWVVTGRVPVQIVRHGPAPENMTFIN